MSTLTELVDIAEETHVNSKNALIEKGLELDDSYKLSDVDERIAEIQSGGNGGYAIIDGDKFYECWHSHVSDLDRNYPAYEFFKTVTFCTQKAPSETEVVDISKDEDGSVVMWYLSETKEFFVSTQSEKVKLLLPNNRKSSINSDEYNLFDLVSIFTDININNGDSGTSIDYDPWYFDEIKFSNIDWEWESQSDFSGTFAGVQGKQIGIDELISKVDFSKIVIADYMFAQSSGYTDEVANPSITTIPDMNNCLSAKCMFYSAGDGKDIVIGDMENLVNAYRMFYYSGASSITLGHLNNVIDATRMFYRASVTSISIKSLDNCLWMERFLQGTQSLTDFSLGYKNHKTHPLDMQYSVSALYGTALTEIDLSSIEPNAECDLYYAFNGQNKLTTIYAGNWSDKLINTSSYVFQGCTSLKGAVSFSSSYTDSSRCNYTKGYFTDPSTKPN